LRRIAFDDGVPGQQQQMLGGRNERLRDVREGPDGALYLLTDEPDGKLLRLLPE
jgi:glucose/arabinose dehydrogenase